jgi:hypothetical protein
MPYLDENYKHINERISKFPKMFYWYGFVPKKKSQLMNDS